MKRMMIVMMVSFLSLCVCAGCASTAPVDFPKVDRVEFVSPLNQQDIIDAATSVLVEYNFQITLVNERIGLIQTDSVDPDLGRTCGNRRFW